MKWPWTKKKKHSKRVLNLTLGDLKDLIQATTDCMSLMHLGEKAKYAVELCENIPWRYEFVIHRGQHIASISIVDTLHWLQGRPQYFYGHIVHLVNVGEQKIKQKQEREAKKLGS